MSGGMSELIMDKDFVVGQDVAFTSRGGRRMVGELVWFSDTNARVLIETIDGEFCGGSLTYYVRRDKLEQPRDDE